MPYINALILSLHPVLLVDSLIVKSMEEHVQYFQQYLYYISQNTNNQLFCYSSIKYVPEFYPKQNSETKISLATNY